MMAKLKHRRCVARRHCRYFVFPAEVGGKGVRLGRCLCGLGRARGDPEVRPGRPVCARCDPEGGPGRGAQEGFDLW